MTFSSLSFLFIFLPVCMILYYLLPDRFRNIFLIIVSLVFYAWGSPIYTLLLLLTIAISYLTGLELAATADQAVFHRVVLITGIAACLLPLGFYKYAGFLVSNINALFHTALRVPELPLPIGISFFTFTALSYILDIHQGRTAPQKNILNVALYLSFFPKLASGPIVQYADMEQQIGNHPFTMAKAGRGINQFLVGLMKKVLIADNLGTAFAAISTLSQRSAGSAWLGIFLYGFQLYYDFSGYSDMAIGLARVFGFEFEANFNYPYLSGSIAEFWRRWHISLGAWFRQYIYIPMGGNRCSLPRQILNLAVVWLLTGIWHGASWSFVVWGLYHGGLIILERFVLKDYLKAVPNPLRIAVTALLVFIGWVFFFSPTLGNAFNYLGQMFGSDQLGFLDETAKYYLSGNILILLASAVGSGPLLRSLHQNIVYRHNNILMGISVAAYILLLICTVASIISASYVPFLYAQF